MKPLFWARLAAACVLSLTSASAALVNGNFDTAIATIPEGSANCSGTIGFPGWNSFGFGCGTGQFNPGASAYAGGNAPSNDYVAYHNGPAGFWQTDSSEFWTAGVTHTFRILIGQRLDETYSGYTLELWAGDPQSGPGTLVASQSNAIATPAPGTFSLASLSFTPGAGAGFLGQNVTVVFRGGLLGTQTNFDNAELTTGVPEPATYALVGSALFGLAALRRRPRG